VGRTSIEDQQTTKEKQMQKQIVKLSRNPRINTLSVFEMDHEIVDMVLTDDEAIRVDGIMRRHPGAIILADEMVDDTHVLMIATGNGNNDLNWTLSQSFGAVTAEIAASDLSNADMGQALATVLDIAEQAKSGEISETDAEYALVVDVWTVYFDDYDPFPTE
jgi:hypothetical protein